MAGTGLGTGWASCREEFPRHGGDGSDAEAAAMGMGMGMGMQVNSVVLVGNQAFAVSLRYYILGS